MAGFIQLDRDIFEEPYFKEERYSRCMAFIDLCYMASYKPYSVTIRGNVVDLQPFQLAKSADYLAGRWGWNRKTVFSFLSTLQNIGYIGLQKSRIITVITIKKGIIDGLQNGLQSGLLNGLQSGLQNGLQTGLQNGLLINKEYKENKEYKDIIPPIAPQGDVHEKEELLARIAELEESKSALAKEMEAENAELKKKVEKARKAETELDMSIVEEKMLPVVEEWLAYKRQKRQSYKPRGFAGFYKKLMKDCGGSVAVANEMVEYSIANNYDGLFKPKGNYRGHELTGQVMRGEKREYNEDNFFGR